MDRQAVGETGGVDVATLAIRARRCSPARSARATWRRRPAAGWPCAAATASGSVASFAAQAADAVDLVAIVAAGRELPLATRLAGTTMAAGSAAVAAANVRAPAPAS